MTINEQVAALQRRIKAAQEQHSMAKLRVEAAERAAEQARQRLRKDFNVATVGEAATLIARYQDELSKTMTEMERALDEAER